MDSSGAKCAWVTAITNDKYVVGAQALARSLAASQSRFTLEVLATPKLSDAGVAQLKQEPNIRVSRIQPYLLPPEIMAATSYAFARFADNWTKLRCWELVAYDKLCWVDSDMLVLQNMDEIFDNLKAETDKFAAAPACICNPNRISSYPDYWCPENCKFTHLEKTLEAASTGSDLPPAPKRRYFNAGLLLFRPSLQTLAELEQGIRDRASVLGSYVFAEQDFLNDYYSQTWIELPFIYNALKTVSVAHSPLWDLSAIKNIHYILDKPWDADLKECGCQDDWTQACPCSETDPYHDMNRMWWRTFFGSAPRPSQDRPSAVDVSSCREELAVGE